MMSNISLPNTGIINMVNIDEILNYIPHNNFSNITFLNNQLLNNNFNFFNYSLLHNRIDSILYFKKIDMIIDYFEELVNDLKIFKRDLSDYKDEINSKSNVLLNSVNEFWDDYNKDPDWGDIETHLGIPPITFGDHFPPKRFINLLGDLKDIIFNTIKLLKSIASLLSYITDFITKEINKITNMIL